MLASVVESAAAFGAVKVERAAKTAAAGAARAPRVNVAQEASAWPTSALGSPAARARRAKTGAARRSPMGLHVKMETSAACAIAVRRGAAKVRRAFATTALPARSTAATLERARASTGRAPDAASPARRAPMPEQATRARAEAWSCSRTQGRRTRRQALPALPARALRPMGGGCTCGVAASGAHAPNAVWLPLVLLGITWLRRQRSANAGK